jgi:hypothetical protein
VTDRRHRTTSIADATREYIDEHPSIREALREDLVNYTALARKIQAERELPNEEAVTIACRRYQRGLATESPESALVRSVIGRSRLQVQSRVALVRFGEDWELLDRLLEVGRSVVSDPSQRRVFELLQGTDANTILCEESFLPRLLEEIPPRLRLAVERGLAIIAFRSHREVEETPGVLSYMVEALARRGINCLETVSVDTDSIFVFRDRDVIPAYQILSSLLDSGDAGHAPRGPASASRGRHG